MPIPPPPVPSYREVAATDPAARLLLEEYFSMRVRAFPPEQGDYTVTPPSPDAFRAPDGVLLLAELERRARLAGANDLVLDTNSSLTAAAHLYARSGFAPIAPYNDNPNADRWYGKRL